MANPPKSIAIVCPGESVRSTWPSAGRYDLTIAVGRAVEIAPRPSYWMIHSWDDTYATCIHYAEGAPLVAPYSTLIGLLSTLKGEVLERFIAYPAYSIDALVGPTPVETYPTAYLLSVAYQLGATSIDVFGADFFGIDTFSAAPLPPAERWEERRAHEESHFNSVAGHLDSLGVQVRRVTFGYEPEWTAETCRRFLLRPRSNEEWERTRAAYSAWEPIDV